MVKEMKMIQALNLRVIKSSLCDYLDAYILVTRCVTHINGEQVDTAENLDIVMNMYNLVEYSDNYAHTSGTLYQLKKDEQSMSNGNPANVTADGSLSFE